MSLHKYKESKYYQTVHSATSISEPFGILLQLLNHFDDYDAICSFMNNDKYNCITGWSPELINHRGHICILIYCSSMPALPTGLYNRSYRYDSNKEYCKNISIHKSREILGALYNAFDQQFNPVIQDSISWWICC